MALLDAPPLAGDETVLLSPPHGVTPVSKIAALANTGAAITGGSINNTPIGATTPGTGAFTTLSVTGNIAAQNYIDQGVSNALTAAGTTRTDALPLTEAINRITTAASGTGVVLPIASTVGVGGSVLIFNDGASLVQVYATGSETIDGVAGSTGVALTDAKRCLYYQVATGAWISAQLGVVSA